ncbi:MAG TPA: sensor histidine kinase N-terminal domain-containing protein [Burkholderiales bacterium]|nr:sensor histidine kinase N-terminal domain-containing protein [Burkholderiales bacterium]
MNSIRSLLSAWLLFPLTGLLLLTALIGYPVILHPVTDALDWALMDSARTIARLINTPAGYTALAAAPGHETVRHSDTDDETYFSVRAADGTLLAGDAKVAMPDTALAPGADLYYDSVIDGRPVRVAAMLATRAGASLLVQVAETNENRTRLTRQIFTGVMLVEIALIAMVGWLVSRGIRKGLRPLRRLGRDLEARSPGDLGPVHEEHAPLEAQPLVRSINVLLRQLAVSQQAQRQFVADAAHQLRTPLAGLRIQLEYALQQSDPQEWRRTLAMLMPATARTVHLAHQLLTLARTEANPGRARSMNEVDVADVVKNAASQCMPKAIERDIDLGLELGPCSIVGDAAQLHDLALNLIDNALSYTPRGASVTVRTATRGDARVLEVEDEGPGIPEAERARIFQRFYRIVGSEGDGCGLGLAIVQEIAQAHHGRVSVGDRASGPGSVFTVEFPGRASGTEISAQD